MIPSYDDAVALDAADPLSRFREEFLLAEDPVAYLDGNSLGRPPLRTLQRVEDVLRRQWGERLIRSWEEGWLELPEQVGDRLAAACLGAAPGQTVIAESTSVNLFKVLHAGCDLRPDRDEIVAADVDFPTDRYLVDSVAASRGMTVRWLSPDVVEGVTEDELRAALSDRTALVLLSHVDYRSGALLDLPATTALVHEVGALAIWDLCHSAGVVPIELDEAGVDLAVGCTYKYLNAGPGAPAFLYVAQRHLGTVRQPITGWWSTADRFAMGPTYDPDRSIRAMLSGTAYVPGIAAVDASVSLVAEAGIDALRTKAVALTQMCVELADAWLVSHGFVVASPRDPARRGAHVTVQGPQAREVAASMYAAAVIPDFRNPDMIRLGLSPLTTSYAELWTAMDITREIVEAL
ncbi:kynureninase [Mumia sp. zg.B53]|uniref:kynureninase n=1 Tax=Mumia sp. zg.B53 TaxID=2855449 RepID=UPI001C6F20F6|nr:kynureninase [Mumia sp. zg.B53]MBW9216491.1 kynureninase [Mumia sp. zg.B53]